MGIVGFQPLSKKAGEQRTVDREILKANHLGIVNRKSENQFAPNDKIKREEIAVMFHRLLNALEINPIVTEQYVYFSDKEQISQWAKNAIQLLNKLGIIN